MPNLVFLKWDSDFFGRRIFCTDGDFTTPDEIRAIDDNAHEKNASLIYHFQSQDNIGLSAMICAGGFHFIEQKAFFTIKDKSLPLSFEHVKTSYFSHDKYSPEDLYPIALSAARFSRFALEPSIGLEKTKELYRRWVDNSCAGIIADRVIIVESKDGIQGLCTLQSKNGAAVIGILSVREDARKKGVGKSLMYAARAEAARRGEPLLVATQSHNTAAMNFYFSCGLTLCKVQNVFHKNYNI